jgi:hypothetical protein
VAPRCGQRNSSSSATKRMNQQLPESSGQTQHDMHNVNIPGSEPFPNKLTHNMPLWQFSGEGLTPEAGFARELGSLLSVALRSAPPKADTIRTGWPLLHRRHRPQMPLSGPTGSHRRLAKLKSCPSQGRPLHLHGERSSRRYALPS